MILALWFRIARQTSIVYSKWSFLTFLPKILGTSMRLKNLTWDFLRRHDMTGKNLTWVPRNMNDSFRNIRFSKCMNRFFVSRPKYVHIFFVPVKVSNQIR